MSPGRSNGRVPFDEDAGLVGPAFEAADLKRAFDRLREDNLTDHAAGLTYYALLSLFPALLFAIAVLGLVGEQSLVRDAVQYLRDAGAPSEMVMAIRGILESAIGSDDAAAGALVVGLASALYGSSGAFGAVGRALNVVWRVEEGRGFVRRKAMDLVWTLTVLLLGLITLVLVFLGGGVATDVFGALGLGETAADVWRYARWPAALCTALLVYALLYWAAPNVRVTRFHWITPGAVAGVLVWLAASALFFLYVSNLGSYNKTYGAFAGLVILLVWLWISNVALLFGAEVNAVIRIRRAPELPRTYEGPPLAEKVPAES